MKVLVAGAGIGGLTLAAALGRRGVEVSVLERARSLGPVGAGITVQPNAMRALRLLGLDAAVAAAGAVQAEAALLEPGGHPLTPPVDLLALADECGAPTIAIHRARLHDLLLAAAGADSVRTGAALVGFEEGPGGVSARLEGGAVVTGDLLVGADGLRSAVRAQLVGDGEPVYAGYTSWRGVVPGGAVSPPAFTSETWGRGRRFGVVPIGNGEIYWFATANSPPGGVDRDARAELHGRFGDWHPPIAEVLAATPADRILRTDVLDRPPIRTWHRGRVVLLGDAAHPMTPNFGQGGCQAIEDAVVLDDCLASRETIPAALAAYEARRVERANAIVRGARDFGRIAQWEGPVACALRKLVLRATPRAVVRRRMRRILTFPG